MTYECLPDLTLSYALSILITWATHVHLLLSHHVGHLSVPPMLHSPSRT